jgi:hypothetical protein
MTLNPLRHLTGKLNHLQITKTYTMRSVELANSIKSNN